MLSVPTVAATIVLLQNSRVWRRVQYLSTFPIQMKATPMRTVEFKAVVVNFLSSTQTGFFFAFGLRPLLNANRCLLGVLFPTLV